MIPDFIKVPHNPWEVLPPGIFDATITDVYQRYAINFQRVQLYHGLRGALENLFQSGCPQVFLDGSYVTSKPVPNDYELCWDINGVDPNLLDPVFFDIDYPRTDQKKKYGGEFFPATLIEGMSGKPFLEFFQKDADGNKKGIVRILNFLKKGGQP